MQVKIRPVDDRAALDAFLRLPYRLHENDAAWVPPLDYERREALDRNKNPLFRHVEAQQWIAERDGRIVGRISAQIDSLSPPALQPIGQFGLLAAEDDAAVFQELFGTAEAWLRARGKNAVRGPFNLSINEETGLLVDGFQTPPMLLMPHDLPYVGPRIAEQGYAKAKDLIAYLYDVRNPLPEGPRRLIDRPLPANVTLRPLSFKTYQRDLAALIEIFNDAWSENWGFVPLTPEETDHMAKSMKPLLHERMVWFVEIGGEPAGFILALPNLNEAIADLGGSLVPFGWAKLLWRLKVRGLKTGRVPLMGVKRRFASGLLGAALPFLLIDRLRNEVVKLGYERIELSWILEDNLPMRRINEALGGDPYKTYRVYEKALA